ncbi:2387_t:CDS:2, partial [Dentiscutata heterogama]
ELAKKIEISLPPSIETVCNNFLTNYDDGSTEIPLQKLSYKNWRESEEVLKDILVRILETLFMNLEQKDKEKTNLIAKLEQNDKEKMDSIVKLEYDVSLIKGQDKSIVCNQIVTNVLQDVEPGISNSYS